MSKPYPPCYCNAYQFPHRLGSGACDRHHLNRIDVHGCNVFTGRGIDGWRFRQILRARIRAHVAERAAV
jgi:hypothetical protein